ncbi:hypothetical protein V6N13_086922 [Hibiscus sabdariffa]
MGESSSKDSFDWRELFAASSDQSLQFFPPTVREGEITVAPPKDVFEEGSQLWKCALVGQFIGQAPNFSLLQKTANLLWGKRRCGGIPLYMDSITASKQRLAFAKVCVEIAVDTVIPSLINVVLSNGSIVVVYVDLPWLPPKCSHCSVFGHSKKTCFASEGESQVLKAVKGNVGKKAVYVQKSHCDLVSKGGNCDASVISVPFVAPVVSGSITVDSALKGKGVIDSAMNSNSSPNASTLVSKEPVASSDMAIASPLPLKPVVVTPWPSALQNGRNVIAGFSNKFSALAAPVETVLSDIVVYVHLPEDVTTSIDGAHVEIDSSPKKTRAAAKGVALLIQDMKTKKNNQMERGKKKGSKGASPLSPVS